jgi:hypothetical protein
VPNPYKSRARCLNYIVVWRIFVQASASQMVGRVSLQLRSCNWSWAWREKYTDKKKNEILPICKEIQKGSFVIYDFGTDPF